MGTELAKEMFQLIQGGAADTIRREGRHFGEADDQYLARTENRAIDKFYKALAIFISESQDVAAMSNMEGKAILWMIDAIKDNAPDRTVWEDRIFAEYGEMP